MAVLFIGIFYALTVQIAEPERLELYRDTRMMQSLSDEQWQEQYDRSLDPTAVDRLKASIGAAVGVWFVTFIYGLFYLLFGKLAGGTGNFKQVMGVTFWAVLIPYGLGSLLKFPLVMAKQSVMEVSLGLAALAPNAEILSTPYQALYFFGDLFVWWGLVVTIIGFQKIHDFTGGKAATVVLMPWLLITGALFGLNMLFI
jgi:hypothetical protein